MKFNKKILTSLAISATSLLMIPMAFTVVSCSNNSPSLKDDALTNIKNNILNKSAASWTLPSTITNENLSNVLNLNDFSRTTNNGFEINNLQVVKDSANDENGTLKIQFELTNGDQKSDEILELSGFLNQTNQDANQNPVISKNLSILNVEQLNGKLITNVTTSQNKPSFDDSIKKPINEIFSEFNNEVFNKLHEINSKSDVTVIGLDQPGEPVIKNGITFPIIRKTLQLETKDKDDKPIVSSPFTLEVKGFNKILTKDDVIKLINMGIMVNPNTIKNTFASEVTDAIASATSQDKTTLFSQDLSNDSNLNLFANYNDVSIHYQKDSIKNSNNAEGSIEATFDVKMSNATFKDARQENSFSVPTKIYGFIIGNPEELNVFTEMDFYSSQKLMAINLYGRKLSTDISKYKIEYTDKNGTWVDDSSNWELQLSNPINENTMTTELSFKRKTIDLTIENIRVSDVSYPNNNLVRLVEKRHVIKLNKNTETAKTFNLDSYTAANAKTNKLINEKWIIDNKNVLFAQKTADLVTQPTDIKNLKLTVDGENNILSSSFNGTARTLNLYFEIQAGKYYDEYGSLANQNLPFNLKIINFSNYNYFSIVKSQIDANDFILPNNEKLSSKTKGELLQFVTPEWLLENKTKFFNGSELITNSSDISVTKVETENQENTKVSLSVTIKKGKYYDEFGYFGKVDKKVTLEFINLFDFKVISESLIQDDFKASDLLLTETETSGQNIGRVTKEWLFANKDKIWDQKATALIKTSDDIDNISATVNNTDKTKLNVTVSIGANKSYDENGLPLSMGVESSFTISGFKNFNELTLAKSEFTANDFELDATKTGMQNENDITSQKILDKKEVIWGPEATSLITSVDDIVIKEIKKTRNQSTKIDVKIEVLAGKFYDSNGLISTTPKEFTINIGGFKDFSPFSVGFIKLDLTVTQVGLSSSDNANEVAIDKDKKDIILKHVQDIVDSQIDTLAKTHEYSKTSSISIPNYTPYGEKMRITLSIKNVYDTDGLPHTTESSEYQQFWISGFAKQI